MGMMRNIVVVPYDPAWPHKYAAEAGRVATALGPVLLRMQHIGSTSVPGLAAKPIIDMLLEVRSLTELDTSNDRMRRLNYEPRGELHIVGRRFFSKGADDFRTHHVHAFEPGHPAIAEHLNFRDYLCHHRDAAERYGELKATLAAQHPHDIDAYLNGKDPLIQKILADARHWRAQAQ